MKSAVRFSILLSSKGTITNADVLQAMHALEILVPCEVLNLGTELQLQLDLEALHEAARLHVTENLPRAN